MCRIALLNVWFCVLLQSESYWIHVKSLASQGEGGILDTDDLVCDVADDREKVNELIIMETENRVM